jgi:hypothetical protein
MSRFPFLFVALALYSGFHTGLVRGAASSAEFYVVTRECSVTVASLEPARHLDVRPYGAPGVKRCAREGQTVRCRAQVQVDERLGDDPDHQDADEYQVLPDDNPVQGGRVGGSWMAVNSTRRTVVTGTMGFSPAKEDPETLHEVASWVCRGVMATSSEARESLRGPAQP